jgi:CBS-domain-containing membrane protein
MLKTSKPFWALTANDLMSRDVELIPREMSLRTAAHLLSQAHISGAPVVDDDGKCIGVISATDFMRSLQDEAQPFTPPRCIHSAWETADWDMIPPDEVGTHMTSDPIMVPPATKIADLAQMMLDAHIHRVIVVDQGQHPIGIVSSTDVLAALAQTGHTTPDRKAELVLN